MQKPFFSIIIPTYNRADLIAGTLKSVLAQTFDDYEVIVVNDGGKDHTEAIVRSLGSDRIMYYYKENGERGAARNFGIEKASGSYITFLDSDDLLYPNHFEEAFTFLTTHTDVTCYAQAYEIKDAATGKVLIPAKQSVQSTVNNRIIKGNLLSCFGVFVKRHVFDDLRFESDRRFAGTEDWLLWLQLAARYPFYFNNKVTGAMLEHQSRSVLSFNEASLLYRTEFLRNKLLNDDKFQQVYGNKVINHIYAHMLTYASLHLAMSRKNKKALRYWLKGIRANASELATRRTLAIFKLMLV